MTRCKPRLTLSRLPPDYDPGDQARSAWLVRVGQAAFALALLSDVAVAAEPNAVGIIMKVSGQTDPDLPLREEVAANTVIKLAAGTEVTFLHYPPTCELVTVAGGT